MVGKGIYGFYVLQHAGLGRRWLSKIQLSLSHFWARIDTINQHDTQTIASKPSQSTWYTQYMILDGWEGNLCELRRSEELKLQTVLGSNRSKRTTQKTSPT
jgi:hypothetical protein